MGRKALLAGTHYTEGSRAVPLNQECAHCFSFKGNRRLADQSLKTLVEIIIEVDKWGKIMEVYSQTWSLLEWNLFTVIFLKMNIPHYPSDDA